MGKFSKMFKNDFTTVSNDMYRDTRLSVAERGMLGTMLSLPDNWDFSIKGLSAILPDGESCIRSKLRKLEEFGYLKRSRIIDKGGKIKDWEYTFSDTPMFLEEGEKLRVERERKKSEKELAKQLVEEIDQEIKPVVHLPVVENPHVVNPVVENRQV